MQPQPFADLLINRQHSSEQIQRFTDLPGYVSVMSSMGCIKVHGDAAASFLQGQFSNQIDDLQPGQQQLQSYCNPKGRALAVFRLLRNADSFYLLLPTSLRQQIAKRLQLYKMRAKVTIEQCDNIALLGVVNLDEPAVIETAVIEPAVIEQAGIKPSQLWRIDPNRQIAMIPLADIESVLESIGSCAQAAVVDHQGWRLSEILNGVAQLHAQTSAQFIPQQINLDLTNGVSFTKGCYPGQEIVARIRYLGKPKQRLIIARANKPDHSQDIQPATPLFTAERATAKAGMVVDCVAINDQLFMTAMVPSSHINQGEVLLAKPDGQPLIRLPMPYQVSTEFESAKN